MTGPGNDTFTSVDEYWYRQRIVDRINELYSINKKDDTRSLCLPDLVTNNGIDLFKAAIMLFGGWSNAVHAAGIKPGSRVMRHSGSDLSKLDLDYWTPSRVLEQIRQLYSSGMDLSASFIKHVYPELYLAAKNKRVLGSWANALKEAKIEYRQLRRTMFRFWTGSRIVNALNDYDRVYGNIQAEFVRSLNPTLYTGSRTYFQTWSRAAAAAHLSLNKNLIKVTLEPVKTYILKEYLKELFELLQIRYNVKVMGPLNQTNTELDLPDLDELAEYYFEIDGPDGRECVTAYYRSWDVNIIRAVHELSEKYPRVRVYYLLGEPRQWLDERVTFINLPEVNRELGARGRDDLISAFQLLGRGGIPGEYSGLYDKIIVAHKKFLKKL